jgi:hypothetical protein
MQQTWAKGFEPRQSGASHHENLHHLRAEALARNCLALTRSWSFRSKDMDWMAEQNSVTLAVEIIKECRTTSAANFDDSALAMLQLAIS